jgi:hypothetical protein
VTREGTPDHDMENREILKEFTAKPLLKQAL